MPGYENSFEGEEVDIKLDMDKEEYEEHLLKFFELHFPDKKQRIEEIIKKAVEKNTSTDLYISGVSLENLGVITKAFYKFDDLVQQLFEDCKLLKLCPKVTRFISTMQSEYENVVEDINRYYSVRLIPHNI